MYSLSPGAALINPCFLPRPKTAGRRTNLNLRECSSTNHCCHCDRNATAAPLRRARVSRSRWWNAVFCTRHIRAKESGKGERGRARKEQGERKDRESGEVFAYPTQTHTDTHTHTHRNTKAVRTCCAALRVRERSDDRSGARRYRDDDDDADDDEDDTLVAATVTGSSASCSSAGLQCKHTNTRTPTR